MTTKSRPWRFIAASCCILAAGCSGLQNGVYREGLVSDSGEPGYITVQHCLIAFAGSDVNTATRTQEEAEKLATELFERAKAGEDFDQIVRDHTDDSPPGIYKMANFGFESDMSSRIPTNRVFPRDGMVGAFGDVGFKLAVGEYGLAPFHPEKSGFGWHIIKRLK
ncbi:MAG: peptidylprolyl isomerase [Planctomycetales bacterium]|nr:peptidylprolyl isomerase [Planctomycetales bacterium]